MILELAPWIIDGITIERDRTNGGYKVFTIPTQWFHIKELSEITPDRMHEERNRQIKAEEYRD